MALRKLKIFVSSPGDVTAERLVAQRVIERMGREFAYFFEIEPVLWEHEPLRATGHFQEQITPPSETDIVVCILWSRLGTRLPAGFAGALGGEQVTGTEWEFEEAARSYLQRGAPDLLVYRKTAKVQVSLDEDGALEQRRKQKKMLDAFIERWFFTETSEFKAAFWSFETGDELEEYLDTHLRKLIRERLPERGADQAEPAAIRWHQGSPFRGLQPFGFDEAAVFFGRGRARAELREALATQAARGVPFVIVFGQSGSGKSSLIQAGLLPDITVPGVIERVGLCRWCVFRPGDVAALETGADLAEGLAAALLSATALPELEALNWPRRQLAMQFRLSPELALQPIRQALAEAHRAAELLPHAEAKLVLVLDQLEEIFTLGFDAAARDAFAALIEALVRSGLVWVVASMRSDFFHRLAELPRLAALAEGVGQYHLLPPRAAEIGQMIRLPARAAGLGFGVDPDTGIGLDAVLEEAAARNPAALPLLEFTLDELFKLRSDSGVLTLDAYRRLGGMEGALARRAEEVFVELPAEVQAALPALLSALVTVEVNAGDTAVARRVPAAQVVDGPASQALLDAFIAARLVLADQGEDGGVVRFAHEAILSRWPRVAEWIEQHRAFLHTRARVAEAAAGWLREGRSSELLLPEGRLLGEARELLAAHRAELDPDLASFIETSSNTAIARRESALRRARRIAAVMAVLAVLAGGAGWQAWRQGQEAETQRLLAETEAQRATAQRDAALRTESVFLAALSRRLTDGGDPLSGMMMALEALPERIDAPRRPLLPEARDALYHAIVARGAMRAVLHLQGEQVLAGMTHDGRRLIALSDKDPVQIADAASGALLNTLGQQPASQAWVTRDDRLLAALGRDETLRVYELAGGSEQRAFALAQDGGVLLGAALDADFKRLVAVYAGLPPRLIDPSDGRLLASLEGHAGLPFGAVFSEDGGLIATFGADDEVRVWEADSGKPVASFPGHGRGATSVAFSPDGRRLATSAAHGLVRILDLQGGRPIALEGHERGVWSLAFSPDGGRVATASADGTARLWDAASGAQSAVLKGHQGQVKAVRFSRDGGLLATGGEDRSVRLWEADGALRRIVRLGGGVNSFTFSHDGRQLVVGAADRTASVWATEPELPLLGVGGDDAREGIVSLALAPAGDVAVLGNVNNLGRLWSLKDGRPLAELAGHTMPLVAAVFSADGQRLLTRSLNEAILWDRQGRQLARYAGEGILQTADLSPDGSRVLTGGTAGAAKLWNDAGAEIAALRAPNALAFQAGFSNDGKRLWARSGPKIWLRDGLTMAPIGEVVGQEAPVSGAFSADGLGFASAGKDGSVWLWKPEESSVRARHTVSGAVGQILPAGEVLLLAGEGGLIALDAQGKARAIHAGQAIRSLSVSADGALAAAVTADGQLRLWQVASGEEVLRLPAERFGAVAAWTPPAFSADGRHLLFKDGNAQARLWPVFPSLQAMIDHGRSLAPRRLTALERAQFQIGEGGLSAD